MREKEEKRGRGTERDERRSRIGILVVPVQQRSRRRCWLFGLLVGSALNADEHQLNSSNSFPTASQSTISPAHKNYA